MTNKGVEVLIEQSCDGFIVAIYEDGRLSQGVNINQEDSVESLKTIFEGLDISTEFREVY